MFVRVLPPALSMVIRVRALINEIHALVIWGRFVCVRFPAQAKAGSLWGRDKEQVVVVLLCRLVDG